jgi:hypothetical protein
MPAGSVEAAVAQAVSTAAPVLRANTASTGAAIGSDLGGMDQEQLVKLITAQVLKQLNA